MDHQHHGHTPSPAAAPPTRDVRPHHHHGDHDLALREVHDVAGMRDADHDHDAHGDHGGHAGHEGIFRTKLWVSLLTIPIVLYSEMIQDWLNFSMPEFPGGDRSVALGASLVPAGWLGMELWWESALLVAIMLLGHWQEMRALGQTQGALAALAKLLPEEHDLVAAGAEPIRLSTIIVAINAQALRRLRIVPVGDSH